MEWGVLVSVLRRGDLVCVYGFLIQIQYTCVCVFISVWACRQFPLSTMEAGAPVQGTLPRKLHFSPPKSQMNPCVSLSQFCSEGGSSFYHVYNKTPSRTCSVWGRWVESGSRCSSPTLRGRGVSSFEGDLKLWTSATSPLVARVPCCWFTHHYPDVTAPSARGSCRERLTLTHAFRRCLFLPYEWRSQGCSCCTADAASTLQKHEWTLDEATC